MIERLVYKKLNKIIYMLLISINGEKYLLTKIITILELIGYLNYSKTLFILEYNGELCKRTNWNKKVIKNNDRIEIITIVGGG